MATETLRTKEVNYSLWQVAHMVGVSKDSIKRWEKQGKIPVAKRYGSGKGRYWVRADVDFIIAFFLGKTEGGDSNGKG